MGDVVDLYDRREVAAASDVAASLRRAQAQLAEGLAEQALATLGEVVEGVARLPPFEGRAIRGGAPGDAVALVSDSLAGTQRALREGIADLRRMAADPAGPGVPADALATLAACVGTYVGKVAEVRALVRG